ncbi:MULTISPECIES: AAA family ATPase [unclassified Roseovarius]|uniref:AAA family ATPase n=1 Tax=unclassified Roseovarius TaxID=2614913 RepID=UPI00273FD5BA|nr:AAA family ATPase [Roseovarius sp. MMSF_3350]
MTNIQDQDIPEWENCIRSAADHSPSLEWNYAIKGWLLRNETSLLYGPSNVGKSALVCHIGNRIVTARPSFGARVKPGLVVHVAPEAPASVLDRIHSSDTTPAERQNYLVCGQALDLSNFKAVASFVEFLKGVMRDTGEDIVLIVFDTLARSIGLLDENCAASMTQVVQTAEWIAKSLNAHVMLVHHTGKDVDRGGRGSSALRAAVDTEICLKLGKSEGSVAVVQDKQRTQPKLASVHFRIEKTVLGLDEDGDERTTAHAVETSAPTFEKAPNPKRAENGRAMAVRIALQTRGMLRELALAPFKTADLAATLPPELFAGVAPENLNRTINRILGDLANADNPIVTGSGGVWTLTRTAHRPPG